MEMSKYRVIWWNLESNQTNFGGANWFPCFILSKTGDIPIFLDVSWLVPGCLWMLLDVSGFVHLSHYLQTCWVWGIPRLWDSFLAKHGRRPRNGIGLNENQNSRECIELQGHREKKGSPSDWPTPRYRCHRPSPAFPERSGVDDGLALGPRTG